MKYMKLSTKDENLLNKYVKERGVIISTKRSYENTIKIYTNTYETTLTETIEIAKKEQNQNPVIPWEERKIYNRLIEFRELLFTLYSENFAKKTFNQTKAILKHNHIIIYELPYWNPRQNKKSEPIRYEDLPTQSELQSAYHLARHVIKAVMVFQLSTGCDKNTTLHLKIQDFIDATKSYHGTNNLKKAITILENTTEPVIGQWRLKRNKTNKYYTTFSTPESIDNIIFYLKSLPKYPSNNEQLFQVHEQTIMRELRNINKKLDLGLVNGYVKLRTHMFRKYHASHLYHNKDNEPIMTLDDIDYLQGRGKSDVRESYFFENIDHLKQKYKQVMYRVTLFDMEHIGEDSPEYQELQKKNMALE